MKRVVFVVLVAALGVAIAASSGAASPTATPAKKCKKHKKKKCRKKSATSPTAPVPLTPPGGGPSIPSCPSVPQSTPGPEYIALGDSVSVGLGAACPANSFVNRLFASYQSTLGVTQLSNLAMSGNSSNAITSNQVPSAVAEINGPTDTRVVTIDTGGIDALGGCAFGSASCTTNVRSNIDTALNNLQSALGSDPGGETLIAMAYPNPYSGTGSLSESSWADKMLGDSLLLNCTDTGDEVGLNDVIAERANAHSALLANPYSAFTAGGQSFISSDHLHPNDAGYQAIFDSFIAAGAPC